MGVYECGICMHGDGHKCRRLGILFSRSLTYALEAGFLTESGAQLVVSSPRDLPVFIPLPEWCYKPVTHQLFFYMCQDLKSHPHA